MSSLYAKYVKELDCGRDIIEIDNVGFISYYKHPNEIYIEDTYIVPEKRDGLVFKELFDMVFNVAKQNSVNLLTHGIVKTHSDFNKMEQRSKKFGFVKVGETDTDCLYARSLKDV